MNPQKKQPADTEAEENSPESEEKLVLDNYGLVVSQALKLVVQKQDLDDYIQIGLMGLLKAIRNYNPEKSKFSTFATVCIRNEILKFMKKQTRQNRRITLRETPKKEILLWEFQPDNLTEDELDILDMKLQNHTYKEISEAMCCNKNEIKQKVKKILKKIREANQDEEEDTSL